MSLNKDEKDAVEKSENEYSLFQLLESWLERTPFLQFEGFDFWDQYSVAVRSLLKNEKSVIKNNPNYSKDEVEYHLKEHERAVISFEAMIDLNKHNELIEKNKNASLIKLHKQLYLFFYIVMSPYCTPHLIFYQDLWM